MQRKFPTEKVPHENLRLKLRGTCRLFAEMVGFFERIHKVRSLNEPGVHRIVPTDIIGID